MRWKWFEQQQQLWGDFTANANHFNYRRLTMFLKCFFYFISIFFLFSENIQWLETHWLKWICFFFRIRSGFKIVEPNGANKKKLDPLDIHTIRICRVRLKYHRQPLLHPHCRQIHSHIWALICGNHSMPAVWPHFVIHTYRAHRFCHQHIYINFTGNWSIQHHFF